MDEIYRRVVDRAQKLKERYEELSELVCAPEILADNILWRRLVAEHQSLEGISEQLELLELALEEKQNSETGDKEVSDIIKGLERLISLGDNDNEIFSVELRAAANDESYTLCHHLLEAYKKCFDNIGYRYELVLFNGVSQNKIKHAALTVVGSYKTFRLENGTHSGVGIGKSRGSGKVVISVLPAESVSDEISVKDIRTDIFHSGGPGGQHVNKTASAVRMTHLPTGVSVVCQDERSQIQNRERAAESLRQKVKEYYARQKKDALEKHKLEFPPDKLVRTYDFVQGVVTDKNITAPLESVLGGGISVLIKSK